MGVGSTALLLAAMATAAGDLEDAITLYQNKDYRGALAAFGRAGAEPQSPRRRALIHAYIGILQFRFGLVDDAKSSFEESLSHASITFPDPSQAGAKRLYESLVETAPPDDKDSVKKKKKRKKRRRRKRTASDPPGEGPFPDEIEEDDPDEDVVATAEPTLSLTPPPAPPPPLTVTTTPPEPDGSIAPWVLAGGAVAAAVAGTVLIVVGRNNGNAAQDPMTSATEAESLYATHRLQVGIGIGALVAAGVAGGVAGVLFATE